MPKGVLPDAAKVLPPAGQKLWLRTFDEGLDRGMSEDEASAYAWTAVKRAGYERKENGKWGKSMETEQVVEGLLQIVDETRFNLGVPFVKVSTTKRTVSGFATLDNVDKVGDILDADASMKAFADWPGNIREMHQKVAVGRAVSVEPKEITDENGNTYRGIYVTAKISKGAEDTWQKVLDGTLAGFSVGGATQEKQREFVKTDDGERECWRITKYRVTELSLVDNPCNQLASITLVKSVGGELEYDDVLDDADEEFEKMHSPGDAGCCMDEINAALSALEAWRKRELDENDDYGVINVTRLMANVREYMTYEEYEHRDQEMTDAMAAINKSDDSIQEKEEPVSKETEVLHNNEINGISDTEELTDSEKSLFRKFIDYITNSPAETEVQTEEPVEEVVEKEDTPEMNEEAVREAITAAGEELTKSVDDKFVQVGEALTKVTELLEKAVTTEALEAATAAIEELTGRVAALENSGAVKKSADAVETTEVIEKSDTGLWGGNIVPEFLQKQMAY